MEPSEEIKGEKPELYDFKTTSHYYNCLRYSAKYVSERIGNGEVAVVLGSGLGGLVDTLENPSSIEYKDIPYMPQTSVIGHGKSLYQGTVGGKKVLWWSGRVHMYEGYASHQLTFINYLSAFLGCKYIILTNSSGGCLEGMQHGSLMVSKDHLNFAGKCPIPSCFNDPRFGERNPSSTLAHSKYLKDLALKVADENDIKLFEGIYTWTTGPSFETPLEALSLKKFGGGWFGMSTVPEILSARQVGLEWVVLTMVTNLAAGLQASLAHTEVYSNAMKAGPKLAGLVSKIIEQIDPEREVDIKIKDEISTNHPLPSVLMKNPKPAYPIEDHLEKAIEILNLTNCGYEKVNEAYWFMSFGAYEDIVKSAGLTEIRELPFNEIPNMPSKTSAALHSKIVFATLKNGSRVLLVLNSYLEGLIPTESHFLVHLLKLYGVTSVKFIIEAATTGRRENLKDGCFVVVSDYLNKTYFPPCNPNLDKFYAFKTTHKTLVSKVKSILTEKLGDESSNFDDISLILQDGPCHPTNANVDMFKNANQDLITITSTAAIDEATNVGLVQITFAFVREQGMAINETGNSDKIAEILFEDFSSKSISENIGYTHQEENLEKNLSQLASLSLPLDHTKHDSIEVDMPQGMDVEKFDTALATIKDFLKLSQSSYAGLQLHHFNYNQIEEYFNIKKVVKFTTDQEITQNLPELLLCSLKSDESYELLVVKGILVHQVTMDPATRSMPTRILHRLGVNRFVMIANIFGAHDDMQVGDIFLPTDHLNMSVLNSNTGKNVDEWGLRFYDVSKCYQKDMNEKFEEIATKNKAKVWNSNLFFVSNTKPYAGLSEKNYWEGIGEINGNLTQAVSFQGHSELMTIRHMDIENTFKSLYIGVIFEKCVKDTEGFEADKIELDAYSTGLKKAMDSLQEFFRLEDFS